MELLQKCCWKRQCLMKGMPRMSSKDDSKTRAPGEYESVVGMFWVVSALNVRGMLFTACVNMHWLWLANEIGQNCCKLMMLRCNRLIAAGDMMFTWLPVSNKTVIG